MGTVYSPVKGGQKTASELPVRREDVGHTSMISQRLFLDSTLSMLTKVWCCRMTIQLSPPMRLFTIDVITVLLALLADLTHEVCLPA